MNNLLEKELQNCEALSWASFKEISKGFKKEEDGVSLLVGITEDGPLSFKLGSKGDNNFLCVGGSGAGKTVLLNGMVTSLCQMYSTSELELYLTDLSGYELENPNEISTFRRLPNTKKCTTIHDMNQIVNIFDELIEICDERAGFLKKYGYKDVYHYNRDMKKLNKPERCLPEIVHIVTGFSHINSISKFKQDKVKSDLLQLLHCSEAVGIHIGLFTLGVPDMLTADIKELFSLRLVLRCERHISEFFADSHLASTIRNKNGFMYCKNFKGKTTLCKVPFISDELFSDEVYELRKK